MPTQIRTFTLKMHNGGFDFNYTTHDKYVGNHIIINNTRRRDDKK